LENLNRKTGELEQANLKLKEVDRLKSMFIASMSHELRTPLNSIINFSSVLHDEWLGPVNSDQKENLANIQNSSRQLLNLINDVIDVTKIEAGKIEAFVGEFRLSDLIDEAVNQIMKEIEEKGLELRIRLMDQQMLTDRRRLLQCVSNFLSNAVKFTENGSITVETRTLSGESVEISVTDTGIGINADEMTKLFKPFVRLVSPIQATIPGTGLGLYLTKKLAVDILKGDVSAASEYGKGSRFTLRVPASLP
jgi:signal transduction histidine kinase